MIISLVCVSKYVFMTHSTSSAFQCTHVVHLGGRRKLWFRLKNHIYIVSKSYIVGIRKIVICLHCLNFLNKIKGFSHAIWLNT